MRVGLLGPASSKELAAHLDGPPEDRPPGMGGFPVTLLANALVERGVEVQLLTLDLTIDRPVRARGERLTVTYLPCREDGRGRDAYARERALLTAAASRLDVDLWNPHWSYEYAQAVLGLPDPALVTVHDWAPAVLRYYTDAYRAVRLAMFMRTHVGMRLRPRGRGMTTPSPYLQTRIRRAGLGRATVVPNGLPVGSFAAAARQRGPGREVLGIAVGFTELKNTRALMRACAVLRRRGTPVRLSLVGTDHGPGGAAQQWADEEGVADGIQFLGMRPRQEVLDLVANADLLVHPSREESFGMVLIEAMAQGTPVVGGASSGAVPWVLDHGRAGALVDVEDPEDIAATVAAVLDDADRWEAMSEAGLRHARTHFSMDVVADGYLAAYRALLGTA